jgi:hypothetical protein
VRFADVNAGTHQVTFQDTGGTLHYALAPGTRLSLAGGSSHLNDKLLNDRRNGAYVRSEITHDARRTTVGASFERMFVPSFGVGGSTESEQIRGFIRVPFERNRLYYQGSAAWRRSNPFIGNQLELDTIWIRSTLSYTVSRWLRLEAFHAFTRQDSQAPGSEIDRQRGGVQVVVFQTMRIH